MKLATNIKFYGTALALAVVAFSCTRKSGKEVATENKDFSTKAYVQLYNATINSVNTFIYVDNTPINGSASTYGTLFPASSYAFALDAGVRGVTIRNPSSTIQPSLNFSANLEPGGNYAIIIYDTLTSPKQVTIRNVIEIPTDNTARVKFGNFAWLKNGTAPAVDIYSKLNNANVFTNVSPTQVTDYIPYISGTSDSIIVRQAGTTIGLDTAVFNFTQRRSYTLIYRGRQITNEAGGATFPRTISSFANY